jgi:anaerobic magnesium-protoporphyrin IX monomethyl ester cyclase
MGQEIGMHKSTQHVDALIINPSALSEIYQDLSRDLAAIEPPIWAALIANHLRARNYGTDILDCEGLGLTVAQTLDRIADYDARLIVVVAYGQQPSASTQNMHAASALCAAIKEVSPDKKVILVGGHVSALPERTMREEKTDFVCQGEGPATIDGLLQTSDLADSSQLEKVPGLWYRKDGAARFTLAASVIPQADLDRELPGMAFDLLPMDRYRAHNWHCFDHITQRQPYASLYTSLGCPFRCSFCCINAPFGKSSFRYWSPEFIIKQFDVLAEKYHVRNIKIADEMFVLREPHFLELCRLLKQRNHGFNIWAYSRIDTVKPQHLAELKAAGVNWLALGIESKSKFVRDGVSKGRFSDDDIDRIVQQIKNAGIHVIGNFIFGLPDDNFETMNETLDMALDMNCEMANFYSAMAYPGSQLYDLAVKESIALPETWLGYSQHAYETLPLATKHVSAGDVLAFRDYAWTEYFTNPRYLALVNEKFGRETLRHITEMTARQLRRRYASTIDFAKLRSDFVNRGRSSAVPVSLT